jgi:hypothetical protein
MGKGLSGIGFSYKEIIHIAFYSSQQVVGSAEALLFVHVLVIERLTAIALNASLSKRVSAANNDNSLSSKQSAI